MLRFRALPVIGVLALAACADIPVEPSSPTTALRSDTRLSARADVAGTYLVGFKNSIPSDFETSVQALGGEVLFAHQPTGIAIINDTSGQVVASLSLRGDVESLDAEAQTMLGHGLDTDVLAPDNPSLAVFFPRQWNLQVIGAPEAWAKKKLGNANVKVGILDSGIDYLHPEFAGLIDVNLSASFVTEEVPNGALPIADRAGHGTIVAAQIASNGDRIAGVTSRVTLVSLKVCFANGGCSLGATLAAVLDAADKKLDVINLSVGGLLLRDAVKVSATPDLIRMIDKTFRYAHRRGTTVVVAAGNSAFDMNADRNEYHLYCDAPHVICVSATAPTTATLVGGVYVDVTNVDASAPYTNFGRRVDVAAPGGSMAGARIWGPCSAFFNAACANRLPILGTFGTSMAAPQVAGLAALLVTEVGRDPGRILARIKSTATDLGRRGRDDHFGHGRINVAAALNPSKHQRDRANDSDSDSDSH